MTNRFASSELAADSRFAQQHADVLGVKVSAINLGMAVDLANQWITAQKPGYICVTGVHGVMEAQRDPEFMSILNHAFVNVPDGMPMSWVGHLQGLSQMDRVFGPDFMAAMCQFSTERGYRALSLRWRTWGSRVPEGDSSEEIPEHSSSWHVYATLQESECGRGRRRVDSGTCIETTHPMGGLEYSEAGALHGTVRRSP